MKHSDFSIGETFRCGDGMRRCTDIGTRTIIAIRIDRVEVESTDPARCGTLSHPEAEAAGWFKGPPSAIAESVFDEYDVQGCSLESEADGAAALPKQSPTS
jgi:hypothetical protein